MSFLHKKTSNHKGNFYCLNCFNSSRTENKLKIHEKICKNKDFCWVEIPSEKNKILKSNHHTKSEKMLYIIYVDFECLVKKIDESAIDPEKSSTFVVELESIFLADIQCKPSGDLII